MAKIDVGELIGMHFQGCNLFGDLNGDSIGMLVGRKFQVPAEKCM